MHVHDQFPCLTILKTLLFPSYLIFFSPMYLILLLCLIDFSNAHACVHAEAEVISHSVDCCRYCLEGGLVRGGIGVDYTILGNQSMLKQQQ